MAHAIDINLDNVVGQARPEGQGLAKVGSQNPFEISLVLDTFFRFCDLVDLRRFRLVNSTWYNHSLTRWRNEMVVHLYDGSGFAHQRWKGRLGISTAHEMLSLPEYAEKPFCKFRIKFAPHSWHDGGVDWVEQALPTKEEYEKFWNVFGMHMKHLSLWTDDAVPEWNLASWLIEKTPNLESLRLTPSEIDWFRPEDGVDVVQTSLKSVELETLLVPWDLILKKFPNLEEITLGWTYDGDLVRILDALKAMNQTPRKLAIIFDHCICGDEDTVDVLTRLLSFPGVTVKELVLGRGRDVARTNELISLCFTTSGQVLDTVSLVEYVPEDIYRVERPLLQPRPMLTTLYLDCRLIYSLHCLQDTPTLKSLQLEEVHWEQFDASSITQMDRYALLFLETLEIAFESTDCCLRESDVRMVAAFAPNLKALVGALGNASFRRLCALYPDLRRLTIKLNSDSTQFDDTGLTGIRDGDTVIFPNLTNLKYLTEFNYLCDNLSDQSIWNGFLKMDHLWKLNVRFSRRTSDAAFCAMCKRFPTKGVKRQRFRYGHPSQKVNDKLGGKANSLYELYRI